MSCSCTASVWLREWLMSFGAEMPYVGLALLILWWSRKAIRREHFGGHISVKRAIAYNLPALGLFALGAAVLILAMVMR